jgi:hypothetical protein
MHEHSGNSFIGYVDGHIDIVAHGGHAATTRSA